MFRVTREVVAIITRIWRWSRSVILPLVTTTDKQNGTTKWYHDIYTRLHSCANRSWHILFGKVPGEGLPTVWEYQVYIPIYICRVGSRPMKFSFPKSVTPPNPNPKNASSCGLIPFQKYLSNPKFRRYDKRCCQNPGGSGRENETKRRETG